MHKKLLYAFVVLFLGCCGSIKSQTQKSHYKSLKSLRQLRASAPDTCSVSAYVTSIYKCPFCPPGAECKPCVGDHVMVGDSPIARAKNLRILTKDLGNFEMAKKYTFLIKLYKNRKKVVYEAVLLSDKS